KGQSNDTDARWIAWLIENKLLTNAKDRVPRLHELIDEYRMVESRIASAKVFNGMADLDPGYDFPVLPAGDAAHPGSTVPRGFLRLITGTDAGVKTIGSGR